MYLWSSLIQHPCFAKYGDASLKSTTLTSSQRLSSTSQHLSRMTMSVPKKVMMLPELVIRFPKVRPFEGVREKIVLHDIKDKSFDFPLKWRLITSRKVRCDVLSRGHTCTNFRYIFLSMGRYADTKDLPRRLSMHNSLIPSHSIPQSLMPVAEGVLEPERNSHLDVFSTLTSRKPEFDKSAFSEMARRPRRSETRFWVVDEDLGPARMCISLGDFYRSCSVVIYWVCVKRTLSNLRA